MYESSPTYNYLLCNPELIESGIIAIDLRNDCRDFTDFQDFQFRHTKNPFWISDNASKISQFLNDHCPYVIPWNPCGSEVSFKNCLINSIEDSNSTIRRILRGIDKKCLQQVKHEIEDQERVTRSILDQIFTNYSPPPKKQLIMREISIAYYIIGAYDLKSRPALHPDLFSHYQKCLEPIGVKSTNSKLVDSAFSSLLKQYEFISSDILDELSVQQLINIRHSQVISEFRKKWWGIIDDAVINDTGSFKDTERSVYELISNELRSEKKKNRDYRKFKKAIGAASLVVSGMSLIPFPLLSILSFGLSALSFSSITDPLFEKNAGVEFTTLTRRIIDSTERAVW